VDPGLAADCAGLGAAQVKGISGHRQQGPDDAAALRSRLGERPSPNTSSSEGGDMPLAPWLPAPSFRRVLRQPAAPAPAPDPSLHALLAEGPERSRVPGEGLRGSLPGSSLHGEKGGASVLSQNGGGVPDAETRVNGTFLAGCRSSNGHDCCGARTLPRAPTSGWTTPSRATSSRCACPAMPSRRRDGSICEWPRPAAGPKRKQPASGAEWSTSCLARGAGLLP